MSHVLKLVHTHLEPSRGAKSLEERGACFGKGFALLALVSSGVLSNVVSAPPTLAPQHLTFDPSRLKEDFVGVAKELTALGKKKSFLCEFCASGACQLLEACPVGVCRDHVIHELGLEAGWEEGNAEHLQVLLHLSGRYSKVRVE